MKKLLLSGLMLVLLTGCWDRYELEERANIIGLAIDIAEESEMAQEDEANHKESNYPEVENEEYVKMTAQIALPGKIKLGPEGVEGEGGAQKNAWMIEIVGHSIKDAMTNLQQQLAETLYLGHLQVIVISEDVAKRGVSDINDYFKRNPEVRRTSWMVVGGNNAKEVLNTSPPVESVPALYLSDTLDNAVRFGKFPRIHLGKYWTNLSTEGRDAILPSVQQRNGDRVIIDGLTYFKDDKMIDKLSAIEVGVYMAVLGINPGGYSFPVSLPNDEAVYMVEALYRNSNINVHVTEGKPVADIQVKIDADISEEVKGNHLTQEHFDELEKEAEKVTKEIADKAFQQIQENGSDIFGLGARIKAEHPAFWRENVQNNGDWTELYQEMEVSLAFDYQLKHTGAKWN
ncbi:Ger(x)C family spore germination protein [Gracilibacillus sp. HCP3S3_G5_1]|uniref:Ger(x)C family spore germination protein n=1 Tax=unclassified Gracilibacillus TaxID=2625209 RepID=UPI003F8B64A6